MRYAAPLVLTIALAGCGGGAPHAVLPANALTSTTPATGSSTSSTARFTITVPARSAQAQSRNPQYISVNTQSVIITLATVNGIAFTGPQAETAANLTTANPACSGSPLTCAITVPGAPGTDAFTVTTYSAQQTSTAPATPAGSVLSTATVSVNVVSGQASAPSTPLVLNGVAASIVATFPADPHISGTQAAGYAIVGSQPYALTVSPVDASGATIVGAGAPTFTVTSGTNAVAVSSSGSNTFAVKVKAYSSAPVSLAITPSSGTVTSIALTTVQEMWVANYTTNTVLAYGLSATPTPITTDTITPATGSTPVGLAVDAGGILWVSNVGTHIIQAYLPGTSVPISGDTISTGLNFPVALAFDSSGNLWVADAFGNAVTAYVPGTNVPIAADTITAGVMPEDIAFDATGNLWIANHGNSNVLAYNVTPTPVQITADAITALNGPVSVAFNASGLLRVGLFGNSTVTAYTPGTSVPISADTIASAVNNIRFDATGRLWVSNQSSATVTAYAPGSTTPISGYSITGTGSVGTVAFSP